METRHNLQAEDWFVRLHAPDCSREQHEHFDRWLKEPANRAAYNEVERLSDLSIQLRFDPAIRAASRRAREVNRHRQRMHRYLAGLMATAAVIALTIGIHLWRIGPVVETHYQTGVGEQLTEILADGSKLVLDTATTVSVRYDNKERRVELDRGRVQFRVAHDAQRPFIVAAGGGFIRDIGTEFQVRTDAAGKDVTVTLLQGSVVVSVPAGRDGVDHQATLTPGQQLDFSADGRFRVRQNADLGAARAWTQGYLVFTNRPLGEVVAEMNRYTQTSIGIDNPKLDSIPISGVFHEGDQQSLLAALQAGWSLRTRKGHDNDLILYRPHP